MEAHDGDAEHESGDDDGSNAGEEHSEDGQSREQRERLEVREGPSNEHHRLIGGAEEVEEGPRGEEADEDDE